MAQEFTRDVFEKLFSSVTQDDVDKDFKNLSYISWATAWKKLMQVDPTANYEILEKPDGGIIWEEFGTFMVRTSVTAFNRSVRMFLPIMDNNHNAVKLEPYTLGSRPVPALNSRILNDNIMRCLAKNIAMFGIGLALYTKEDIPNAEKDKLDAEEAAIPAKETKKKHECHECGKEIVADGKLTVSQLVTGTTKAYGVPLCAECGRKRKEEK